MSDTKEIKKNQGIQVISRAAGILRLLARESGGLSLGQIAVQVELPRSTVQRIVSALADEGLIATERGHGGIRLGPEIQSLAAAARPDMRTRMRPVMRAISEETGETVDLAILDGGRMLFIDQVVGGHRLRTVSSIGEAFPLTSTANGKAALACLDHGLAAQLAVREFEAQGRPGAPVAGLLEEIAAIRAGALARDENEHTEGICAIGFALIEPGGDVFALSVPVPSSRYARVRPGLEASLLRHRAGLSV